MKELFRHHHLFQILTRYELQKKPLDAFLSGYFRANKSVGAKDRKFIAETVYDLFRWRGLLDHLSEKPTSWEKRFDCYNHHSLSIYFENPSIPSHIRMSFPKILFDLLVSSYGEEEAKKIALISNAPAPTTIRVNILKITREALFEKWKNSFSVSLCPLSPYGIRFHKKINFFSLPEFKEGLFEIQDEGSQLVADLVDAKPGDQVLDFCAGAGGKTLAFAHKMDRQGQIYLHDVRSWILETAKKRLRRAGIQNAQLLFFEKKDSRLHGKMDWILLDVPCSGTGTLRRNPDMKWKFTKEFLSDLLEVQQSIFASALPFLKPTGKIVYSTCSLLPEENEKQIAHLAEVYDLELEKPPLALLPQKGGMDGFFGAVLKKKQSLKSPSI
jgi:16S rRNA (cytosine(967)-C(5))-methyltransferase